MDFIRTLPAGQCNNSPTFLDCPPGGQGTPINAQYMNGVMFELMNVIEKSGQVPIPFDCNNPESYDQLYKAMLSVTKPIQVTAIQIQQMAVANQLEPGCIYNVTDSQAFVNESSYIATDSGTIENWGFGPWWQNAFFNRTAHFAAQVQGDGSGGPPTIISQTNVFGASRVGPGEYRMVLNQVLNNDPSEWIIVSQAASLAGVHNCFAFGDTDTNQVIRVLVRDTDGVTPVDATIFHFACFPTTIPLT